jgi:DNA processing protein
VGDDEIMADKRYWLWLQMALGAGKPFKEIIEHFGSIEDFYDSTFPERCRCEALSDSLMEKLDNYNLDSTSEIISSCERNNWEIITYDDERYPDRLKEIYSPPAVLYVDGRIPNFDAYATISVVGTRKASPYAIKVARLMSRGMARCNAIVVSGGAIGVDSSAHEGALDVNGVTVAVLGCGFGTDYLIQNEGLRRRIKSNGALITEFPPNTKASKYTFPMRNRIISGLANGIFVVEAGVKSGSLITASYATAQNRDIYAVPASILDVKFSGTNKLIDDGAVVATSPQKILANYSQQYKTLDLSKAQTIQELLCETQPTNNANAPIEEQIGFDKIEEGRNERLKIENKAFQLNGDELKVYCAMSTSFEDVDTIRSKCGLEINKVLVMLTMLELEGLAEAASGKRYRKK